jgi:hypothetical protein
MPTMAEEPPPEQRLASLADRTPGRCRHDRTAAAVSEVSTTVERMQRCGLCPDSSQQHRRLAALPSASPVGNTTASIVDLLEASPR